MKSPALQSTRCLRRLIPLLLAAALLPAGCTRAPAIELDQPFAPRPGQRHVQLARGVSYHADAGPRRAILLAFPLPGSKDGPLDYLLYLDLPAGHSSVPIGDEPFAGRGFLIQRVGLLAGKTVFTGGRVTIEPVWLSPDQIRVQLAVECADGTSIRGGGIARANPRQLEEFRRQYIADIALLVPRGEPAHAADARPADPRPADPTPDRAVSP